MVTKVNYDFYIHGWDNAIQFGYFPDTSNKYELLSYLRGYSDGRHGYSKMDISEFDDAMCEKFRTLNLESNG